MKLQINREVPEGLNREYVSASVQCVTVSEREACHSKLETVTTSLVLCLPHISPVNLPKQH